MTQAKHILSKFATANETGISRLAKALDFNRQTVSYWTVAGWIPPRHYKAIMSAAKELGVELTADDFVDFDRCA